MEMDRQKINWDNEFSLRFTLHNKRNLQIIPDSIYSVQLPKISAAEMDELNLSGRLELTLRSTIDGAVENEVFDTLFRTLFNIDVSLSNSNKIAWSYTNCSVEQIEFSPLVKKKANSAPFNFKLIIKVGQIVYHGDKEVIEFGQAENVELESEGE